MHLENHIYSYLSFWVHLFLELSVFMYGPSVGALDAESPQSIFLQKSKTNGRGIAVCLTDLHHMLHARSRNDFQWFLHIPRPPRPLKRPDNFNLLFVLFQLLLFGITF